MQQREKRSIETLKGQTAKDDKTSKINTEAFKSTRQKFLKTRFYKKN